MLFLFSSARKRASEGFGVALAIHGAAMDCQCDMYVVDSQCDFCAMVCQCDISVVDCQCDICALVCQCDISVVDCQCDICFVMKETIVVVIFCVGVLMVIVNNICG